MSPTPLRVIGEAFLFICANLLADMTKSGRMCAKKRENVAQEMIKQGQKPHFIAMSLIWHRACMKEVDLLVCRSRRLCYGYE